MGHIQLHCKKKKKKTVQADVITQQRVFKKGRGEELRGCTDRPAEGRSWIILFWMALLFHGGHSHPNLVPVSLVHFPSFQQDLLKEHPTAALLTIRLKGTNMVGVSIKKISVMKRQLNCDSYRTEERFKRTKRPDGAEERPVLYWKEHKLCNKWRMEW